MDKEIIEFLKKCKLQLEDETQLICYYQEQRMNK